MSSGASSGRGAPALLTVLAVFAVVGVNVGILAYALHRAAPPEGPSARGSGEVAAVAPPAAEPAAEPAPPPPPAPRERAQVAKVVNEAMLPTRESVLGLYAQHCASCHGVSGRGDGPAAPHTFPRPRNLKESPLRFAPPEGSLAEVESTVRRSISEGIPNSSMAGFRDVLTEREIAGLASYVVSMNEQPPLEDGEPLRLGMRPPRTDGLVTRGAHLYESLGCIACHGEKGRGDGPTAGEQIDSLGFPVGVANLTTGIFKSGPTAHDIGRSIAQGVPGTPMIGYEAALARENPDGSRNMTDLWALVAFIESLAEDGAETRTGLPGGGRIVAASAPDPGMLHDPAHPAWLGVRGVDVGLFPIWDRARRTSVMTVRAVRTADQLAIALEWRDGGKNTDRDHGRFSDAAAVMFSMDDDVPPLPMGAAGAEGIDKVPVYIWHWQAHRQVRASQLAERISGPGVESEGGWVVYGAGPGGMDVEAPAAAGEEGPRLPSFLSAAQAGNPLSDQRLAGRAVLESNAMGFGSLTLQEAGSQNTQGTALWIDGLWRVVMVRDLAADSDGDVDFTRRVSIPVAFAAWDGAKGERGGTKRITGWHRLKLDAPPTPRERQTALRAEQVTEAGNQ